MINSADLSWILDSDYSGKILTANHSSALKKRVIESITHLQAIEKLGNPVIPYIAAWQEGEASIWYEFAGRRFLDLFNCGAANLAETFKSCVVDHSVYKNAAGENPVIKHVVDRQSLNGSRSILRAENRKKGTSEAVYKLRLNKGRTVWLKDQACVEAFSADRICLSIGILVDVTMEMKAEENLKKVKEELKQHRDHLEELVRDRTRKLWHAQLEVVQRLSRAAKFRDSHTGKHLTKMSRYCAIIGRAAGLDKTQNALLFHAAPMHDVGKIAITDRILLKPGRLNREEFALMKTHCSIGAELLSGHDSELLSLAQRIALTHHEKWNGSGYPQGLCRENIPMAGRISAVSDVFDALTTDRPYKKAWPFEDAVAELAKQKGSHFDPRLVDLFIENLPAIKEVYWS